MGQTDHAAGPTGPDMDIALGSDDFLPAEIVRIAEAADAAGIRRLWLTEGVGRDAFVLLTRIAARTHRLSLGTGIVNVFSRTPMALIQSTATLLELMPGRDLHLGLGTSGRALVEKFHGIPFDRPVTRLSEVLGIVDTAFATGRLPGPGAVFSTESVALRLPASRASLKLFVAGLGGRTLQVAGSSADGWLPIWPSSRGFPQMLDTVRAAAAEAGRPRPLVAAYVYGVVSAEPRMVDRVRASLAWYVAANGTAYRRLFTDYGYGDEVAEICARWASGDRVGAAHGIPAEMLADCTLTGDTPAFLAGATRLRHLGIDVPVLRFPTRITADECVDMVTRLGGASR